MILWTLTVDSDSIATTLHATQEEAIAALVDNYLQDEDYGDDPLEYATEHAGLVVYLEDHDVPVEIVHGRDPDSPCAHDVYVNGRRDDAAVVVDLDPGRGWTRTDWDTFKTEATTRGTPEFNAAVAAAFVAFDDNQYIEDEWEER